MAIALLDTTHAGYAALEAALLARGQAIYGASFQLDVRALPSTADLALVDLGPITEGDLAAEEDFVNLRKANRPNAACRGWFGKESQVRAFAYHLLGEGGRSSRGIAGEAICFVGAANRGAADGSTPRDCISHESYRTNVATSWATGTVYVLVGFQIGTWGTGSAPDARDPDFQDSAGVPTVWRMDYDDEPGMLHLGVIYQQAGIQSGWSRPDAANHPRVWSCNYGNGFHASNAMWLVPIDPRLSTTDVYANHLFTTVASQTEVENTPFSRWINSTTVWVHMPNDDSPSFRVGNTGANGWNPALSCNVSTASTPLEDLEFINCQVIGASTGGSGAMSNGTDKLIPKAKWLGGRYLFGCSWKPRDSIIDGTEWGLSTDGDICFDTSDRPDPANDNGIQAVINDHGSDAATWAKIARFIEIDSAREGIYGNHGGTTNNPDHIRVNGLLGSNVGSAHPVLQSKFGTDFYTDIDSHLFGNQGGSNGLYQFFYCRRAGAACVLYANGDANNTQNQENNVFQDFVIVENHARATGAGGVGIDITGDGEFAPRSNGTGLIGGCIIRRGYIAGVVTAFGGAPNIDGYAIGINAKDELLISHVTMEDCDHCMVGGQTITTNSTYANHPALLAPQIRVRDCIFIAPRFYFVWHRFINWTATSPANLGYYDFDDNLYIYPSAGNVSTDTPFRFVTTGQTFATWKSNTKGAPPGEQASVYDPNSTAQLAA